MIAPLCLSLLIAASNPNPILLQSMIDSAKIIGLPRLRLMDRSFSRFSWKDEFTSQMIYTIYSRKDFLNNYFKINS